jgi:hypothetical protein
LADNRTFVVGLHDGARAVRPGHLTHVQTHRASLVDGGYINSTGWLHEPVIAAGELRQGRALVEILLPRRSRLLPRHFVLAVTESRIVAFKAWGGGAGDTYSVGIRPGVRASFARDTITLTNLPDGSGSKGATMCVGGECFPVSRPNPAGDWDTDELIALLAGLPPVHVPQEPVWAAFSL